MAFDWFSKNAATESVAELIDKKKYRKALQRLRAEFDKGNRSVGLRLQCAEVLEQTGKPKEAVPILLGVAGELKNSGERERALEVLDKALSLEPTRRDIVNAIRALEEPARAKAAPKPPAKTPRPPKTEDTWPEIPAGPPSPRSPSAATALEPLFPFELDLSIPGAPPEAPAPPLAAAPAEPEPITAVYTEEDLEVITEADIFFENVGVPSEEAVAKALAAAEATMFSDEWAEGDDEAGPNVMVARSTGEFSIADVAEMAVAEGQSDKEALVGYVQELATRFPCAEGARPGPTQVAGALFSDRHEEALNELIAGLKRQDFDPGQAIITEGEHGRSLFILARGRARVLATSAHGKTYEVAELEEGQVFGDLSLEGRPRSATVLAVGVCEALEIAPETFEILSLSRPRASEAIEGTLQVFARSPERAAVKTVPAMPESMPQAALALVDAHLGPKSWNARARMRLAELVAKTGAWNDAVPVLVGLADEMQASGQPARALAILRKIDVIKARDPKEMRLTPLRPALAQPRAGADVEITTYVTAGKPAPSAAAGEVFRGWLRDLMNDARGEGNASLEESPLAGVDVTDLLSAIDLNRAATQMTIKGSARPAAAGAPAAAAKAQGAKAANAASSRKPKTSGASNIK